MYKTNINLIIPKLLAFPTCSYLFECMCFRIRKFLTFTHEKISKCILGSEIYLNGPDLPEIVFLHDIAYLTSIMVQLHTAQTWLHFWSDFKKRNAEMGFPYHHDTKTTCFVSWFQGLKMEWFIRSKNIHFLHQMRIFHHFVDIQIYIYIHKVHARTQFYSYNN